MDYREKRYLKKLVFGDNKTNFTTTQYCKLAKINRNSFYQKYISTAGFFLNILERDLLSCTFGTDDADCSMALENMLKMVYKEWKLYFWIYQKTKHEEHQMMKAQLIGVMKKIISEYANEMNGISNKNLKKVAEGIYDHLLSLILHNCEKSFLDAYSSLESYIPEIEGHRCSYFYKK